MPITRNDIVVTLPVHISERDAIVGTWEGPAASCYVAAGSLVQVRTLVKAAVAAAIQARGYSCTPDEVRVRRDGTWRVKEVA